MAAKLVQQILRTSEIHIENCCLDSIIIIVIVHYTHTGTVTAF